MFGVIVCVVCLALANFGFEWFREVPNYVDARLTTWNQFTALLIYYFIWAEK